MKSGTVGQRLNHTRKRRRLNTARVICVREEPEGLKFRLRFTRQSEEYILHLPDIGKTLEEDPTRATT